MGIINLQNHYKMETEGFAIHNTGKNVNTVRQWATSDIWPLATMAVVEYSKPQSKRWKITTKLEKKSGENHYWGK